MGGWLYRLYIYCKIKQCYAGWLKKKKKVTSNLTKMYVFHLHIYLTCLHSGVTKKKFCQENSACHLLYKVVLEMQNDRISAYSSIKHYKMKQDNKEWTRLEWSEVHLSSYINRCMPCLENYQVSALKHGPENTFDPVNTYQSDKCKLRLYMVVWTYSSSVYDCVNIKSATKKCKKKKVHWIAYEIFSESV